MRYVLAWDSDGRALDYGADWASHIMLLWRDFEPTKGAYNFALVDKALAAADRPCYLQIGFSMYDKTAKAPADYTPKAHRRQIALTAASGVTGYVPDYSPAWTEAYNAAVRALASRYRDDPRVAGYWCACGWGQETLAAVNNAGGQWADLLRPKLAEETYLSFLRSSVHAALLAWPGKPVYLPGAPKPGAVWGHNRRDVLADLLGAGARYMNCALLTDNDTAVGLGGHAGRGMYDIAQPGRVGFEEGPRKRYADAGELYWLLLRALHWRADFVCVYDSLSAPQVAQVAPDLPQAARWIAFRAEEFGAQMYTDAQGQAWGHMGEPGCWGAGLTWLGAGRLDFDPNRYDRARWRLDATDPPPTFGQAALTLAAPGLPDGTYRCVIHRPDGTGDVLNVAAQAERLAFPAGAYHRIDVYEPTLEPPTPDPLPEPALPEPALPTDEARPTATAVRWWLEEEARQREAGNTARADAILYANIALAYRLEGVER